MVKYLVTIFIIAQIEGFYSFFVMLGFINKANTKMAMIATIVLLLAGPVHFITTLFTYFFPTFGSRVFMITAAAAIISGLVLHSFLFIVLNIIVLVCGYQLMVLSKSD